VDAHSAGPGGAWGLEVSSRGAVWTISIKGGCPVGGDHWTHYATSNSFPRGPAPQRLGAAHEEVWAPSTKAPVRFDGSLAPLHGCAEDSRGFDIVAGRSGVWIVDKDGNLSHSMAPVDYPQLSGVVPPAGKVPVTSVPSWP